MHSRIRVTRLDQLRTVLLLVNRLRDTVRHWRKDDYPGASDVTRRLSEYGFDKDLSKQERSMLERIRALKDVEVLSEWRNPAVEFLL